MQIPNATPGDFARRLRRHEHALLVFEDPEERAAAVRAFVAEGLAQRERILLVIHPGARADVQGALSALDDAQAAAGKQVLVFPSASFHDGFESPTRASLDRVHRRLVKDAHRDGFAGVRAALDVTYFLDEGQGWRDLARFENAVGARIDHDMRMLCMLDASHLPDAARHDELERWHSDGCTHGCGSA